MSGFSFMLAIAVRSSTRDRLACLTICLAVAAAVFCLVFADVWSRKMVTAPAIELVAGQPISERGLLLSDGIYEGELKHSAARAFDAARRLLLEEKRPLDLNLSARLEREAIHLARALDLDAAEAIEQHLLAADPTLAGRDLEHVLAGFFAVDATTIAERHRLFYRLIAPRIALYDVPIGGLIALSYVNSRGTRGTLRLPLCGTFRGSREVVIDAATLIEIDPQRAADSRPIPVLWTQGATAGIPAIGVTTVGPRPDQEALQQKLIVHRWLALSAALALLLLAIGGGAAAIGRSPERLARARALRTAGASPRFIAGRLIAEVTILIVIGSAIGGGSALLAGKILVP